MYLKRLYNKVKDSNGNIIETAKLVMVSLVSPEELSNAPSFIQYETDGFIAELPNSEYYLLLLFMKPDGNLFTVIRPRYASDKAWAFRKKWKTYEYYYKELIGKTFEVRLERQRQEVCHD